MRTLLLYLFIVFAIPVFAQEGKIPEDKDSVYSKTIQTRVEKIVAPLAITDSKKANQVVSIIIEQYRTLNSIYTARDMELKNIRENGESKEITENKIRIIEEAVTKKIEALHSQYISKLSCQLTPEQVTMVKDGMTYNVLPITYKAFLEMIPALTPEQKEQLMKWLVEAREIAMDAESSEKKHWWFGKYKGRINNYLSAQGYDLKKERDEWMKRQKHEKEKPSSENQLSGND